MIHTILSQIYNFCLRGLRLESPPLSIPRKFKKKVIVISREDYFALDSYKNNVLIDPRWEKSLKTCFKFGGYKKILGKYFWSHTKLKYFDFQREIYGGIPEILKYSQLCKIENICYSPNAIAPNSVSKYTFRISSWVKDLAFVDKAIAFNLGGADSFQHFLQDCLPIFAATRKFLINNPDVLILLPPASLNFLTREFFISKLEIKNKIMITNSENLNIKELFFWNFHPFSAKYDNPEVWYRMLHEFFSSNSGSENLVLITRDETTRSFENPNEIISSLQRLSEQLKLKFVLVQSKVADLDTFENALKNAAIIVSMHGGANFNLIFANKNSIFFEFVPTFNTNSTLHFVAKLGIKYVPIPIEFSLTEIKKIYIEKKILDLINDISYRFLKG